MQKFQRIGQAMYQQTPEGAADGGRRRRRWSAATGARG